MLDADHDVGCLDDGPRLVSVLQVQSRCLIDSGGRDDNVVAPVLINLSFNKGTSVGAAKPVDTDTALKKVEEKLAKEKEHKEELASIKASAPSNPPPPSPTAPRHDKPRLNPKQLLRRPSANPTSPTAGAGQSEIDAVVAAKAEIQNEAISVGTEKSWRKSENPQIPAATVATQEDEAGWETVPSRSKKINGVGARH